MNRSKMADNAEKTMQDRTIEDEDKSDTIPDETFQKSEYVTTRRSKSVAAEQIEGDSQCKMFKMLERINTNLESQAKSLKTLSETCTHTQQSLQYTQKEVAELQEKNKTLEKANRDLQSRVLRLEKRDRDHERRLDELDYKYSILDNKEKKFNIVIEGVSESGGENPVEIAMDILLNIAPELQRRDIDLAYRYGKGENRPIVVSLVRQDIKRKILSRKKNLKNSRNMKNVHAKQKGVGLVIDGVYYPHIVAAQLPPAVKLAKTKARIVNTITAFTGHLAPLSNMYPAETTIDGIAHPTAEHAYQYAKATFPGDHAQAQKISDTTNPYTAKQLGKSVYVPAWDARKETVLKEVMTRKFEQSRSLRDELLSTGDNTLVECTADGFWGAGCSIDSRHLDNHSFKGRNTTGILLKEIRTECKVFNSSLQKCQFPASWKKSNIVPLPKVPNVKVANDLRPISLLPLPGKVLEKIMCKRLNAFLENNRIISDKQHGFRKQRSTITSITALLDQVYLNLNNSQPTYMAFLDLRKAFDSVSHPILLDKLKEIGLPEQMVEWCKNYLTERKQRVICGELKSEYQNVVYGVPQGSVLGPILFNIYINKLPNIAGDNIQMYADDAVVFDTDPLELQQKLNYIVTWFNQNMLTLNIKKTQWLSVGPQRNTHNVRLFAGNAQLDRVGNYKYLGLEIDANLDYHLHRQKLIGNVHSKINYLTTIRSFLTTSAALTIYKSTILPLIDYCDFVYDQNISYTNQQIQNLQNRALRVVFNQHRIRYDLRLSTDTLHERAKISRLIYRRYQHLLIYGHYLCETPAHIDGRNLPTRTHLGLKLRTITVKNNKYYRSIYIIGAQKHGIN